MVQAGLELVVILLSQPPECCKFRHKPLYLHTCLFLIELICLFQSCLSSPETSVSLSACPLCCAAPGEPDLRRYIPPRVPSAWCRDSHTAGPQSQVGNGSAFSQVERPIRRSARFCSQRHAQALPGPSHNAADLEAVVGLHLNLKTVLEQQQQQPQRFKWPVRKV